MGEFERSRFCKSYEKYISDFDEEEISELTSEIKLLCGINGVLFRCKENPCFFKHIPITLFPTPYPKELFQFVKLLQQDINTLLYRVSNDHDFLLTSLESTAKADPFVQKLTKILEKSKTYNYSQKIQVGIIRSDYMVHDVGSKEKQIKLVEYNTVSVSFGAHASKIQKIHHDVLEKAKAISNKCTPTLIVDTSKNKISEDIGLAISTSWIEYAKKYDVGSSCILFVIQDNEQNIFDHAKIENRALGLISDCSHSSHKHTIPAIFYVTLRQLYGKLTVDEVGTLKYCKGTLEVALVYFRAGYTPSDYVDEDCWKTRELIELSRAIKIPTIGLHLAGCKKIQQLLTNPDIIDRYLPKEVAQKIMKTFIGTYSLEPGTPEFMEISKKVAENPENYVLKPQREGGGNNIYGKEIVELFKSVKTIPNASDSYILMEMIKPTIYRNYLVQSDKEEARAAECLSEVGIWGVYVVHEFDVLLNLKSGYLLRTKSSKELDGGVASGRAVLDSLCLY
ncbi:Glutathione synthetase [Thelohanellus kitauei]|uniref:Glutathione synthetase n=1 Tax=Thelohanellus kitauei TaxID=669202 RepID=A0A0C2MM05_THEKT|nr:Glutathione synthetase [Thelohanellus kitauei]